MTLKEAVLQSLEDTGTLTNHLAVTNHIIKNLYCDFGFSKTPPQTILAVLGDMMQKQEKISSWI